MELDKVHIKTDYKYTPGNHSDPEYFLILEVPLPGGNAVYELPISEALKTTLEYANTLANKVT